MRHISPTAIEVEVLESFVGDLSPRKGVYTTTVLRVDNRGNSCDFVFGPERGQWFGIFIANNGRVHACGQFVGVTPERLSRLREITAEPQIPGLPRINFDAVPWAQVVFGLLGALLIAAAAVHAQKKRGTKASQE